MQRFLTRFALGIAAATLMSMAAPSTAQAAVYRSFSCIAFENGGCTVVQYCEVDTGTGWWFCTDTAGGYQEGRIVRQESLVAQAAPEIPAAPRMNDNRSDHPARSAPRQKVFPPPASASMTLVG